MTAEHFCHWLQGFAELNGKQPTEAQWASIKEHLNLVFTKVTTINPTATITGNGGLSITSTADGKLDFSVSPSTRPLKLFPSRTSESDGLLIC
jgi:hypothetical protein